MFRGWLNIFKDDIDFRDLQMDYLYLNLSVGQLVCLFLGWFGEILALEYFSILQP